MQGTDPARVMMPPPLYLHTTGDGDPIDVANRLATEGADPGLVVWQPDMQLLRMAVLLCPDKADAPLSVLAALALAEALEADGPPQMHMALAIDGAFFLNGAVLGHINPCWPDQGAVRDGVPD